MVNGELRNKRFEELTREIVDLHLSKCKDYGTTEDPIANLREFGLTGVVIRINDKVVRLKSFVRNGTLYVKDESVVDTLKDLATYSLLGIQLYEEELKQKNEVVPSEGLSVVARIRESLSHIHFTPRTSPTETQVDNAPPTVILNKSETDKDSLDNYPSLSEEKRKFKLPKF